MVPARPGRPRRGRAGRVGLVFHRLSGHPYPHRPTPAEPPAPAPAGFDLSDEDLDAVLARVGETFDIDREDLRLLLAELELQVQSRPDQSTIRAGRGRWGT